MRLVVGMALLLSLPALAAETGPPFRSLVGKIVRARCHMDVCTWFSIEASVPAGESRAGTLLRTTIKDWSSSHPDGNYATLTNRKYVATSDEYFLCSKSAPGVIYKAPDQGDWRAYRVWPDHADKIFGYNEALYVRYWAACHAIAVADVYVGGTRLAASLGYRTAPPQGDEEQKLASPEAALLW